jgi:hypothetical protein
MGGPDLSPTISAGPAILGARQARGQAAVETLTGKKPIMAGKGGLNPAGPNMPGPQLSNDNLSPQQFGGASSDASPSALSHLGGVVGGMSKLADLL